MNTRHELIGSWAFVLYETDFSLDGGGVFFFVLFDYRLLLMYIFIHCLTVAV